MSELSALDHKTLDARLLDIVAIHFDPEWGTPYWLDRAKILGLDPRVDICTVRDLPRLGLMRPDVLLTRPITDFIPQSLCDRMPDLIVAQTGGTLGRGVWTVYTEAEYRAAFVAPFISAARHVGFPSGGVWLYVGPSGPHIIARAADAIARETGSMTPFCVDFDVRWARKMPAGSFGNQRYLEHILDQAMDVIGAQPIDTLFSTPIVIRALGGSMSDEQRERIRGVHYGGMAISSEEMHCLQVERFPRAVHLSGYGNTLFGCCLELDVAPGRALRYFPHGDRILFGVVPEGEASAEGSIRYGGVGSAGRLVFSRLDRTMFLANVLERDRVRLVGVPSDAPAEFGLAGVASPEPIVEGRNGAVLSLY